MRCSQPSRPESRLLALRGNSESLSPMCKKCWPHNLEDLGKADNLPLGMSRFNLGGGGVRGRGHGEAIVSKAITKEDMALLEEAGEMFNETGCVPGIDGEQVPAERIVPDVKEYISEMIDDPEAIYDPEIWNTPGLTLVLSWLAKKCNERFSRIAAVRTLSSI